MRLYEIDENIRKVVDNGFSVDADTGEILFDESDLESLKEQFSEKVEACLLMVKELRYDSSAMREEEKSLAERRRAAERKADGLLAYVTRYLDGERFETARTKLSYRKSRVVEIDDEAALPEGCYTTMRKPDKKAIKAAIDGGAEVPGAHVVEKTNAVLK